MSNSRGFTGAMMRAYGAGEWIFTVTHIEDLTEHYRRITFSAPGFFDGPDLGPASYVRFWMPDAEQADRQHHRAYTVVDSDPVEETLVIDVVLHEPSGPASDWAARTTVGDQVATTKWGSPRFTAPTPAPAGYLLIGDPAAIPAVNGILSDLPDDVPVSVLLEYTHDADRTIPLVAHAGATVTWVRRTGAPTVLVDAIEARDYSDWFVWVTAEVAATKEVRKRLKEWGFPRSAVHAQGYWTQGKAMGKTRADDETSGMPSAPVPDDAAASASTPDRAEVAAAQGAGPSGSWRTSAGSALVGELRPRLLLAGIAQVFVSLLRLTPFVLLAELCRRLLSGDLETAGLVRLGAWGLGVMVAGTLLTTALLVAMHLLDANFGREVRGRIIDRLDRLPLGWFDDRSSGVVKKAVDDNTASLHYLVTHAVLDLVAAVVAPLAVLIYLFIVDPKLGGVLLLPLFVYYVLMMRMFTASSWGVPIFEAWRERISSEAIGFLDGIGVARTDDRGPSGRFARLLEERSTWVNSWQHPLIGQKTAVDAVTRPTTSLLLITGVGGLFVMLGWTSPQDLVPFLLLGVTFGAQLLAIAYGGQALRESLTAAREIGLVLTEPILPEPLSPEPVSPGSLTPVQAVRFDGVSFGYSPRHRVIHDLDLTLQPGTMTALVGASGSGKSTLAALLARFHDVDSGAITIGGRDVRDLTRAQLYGQVGFAFQGASLVRESLHDNIALGRPDATRADVERAARAAQIHDRIARLDRGYDAVVGEDARLSGGEAQRVAIARLLVSDPPILVLDEATSFADPESEHLVQQALSALVADRTVLVIAHRLHTIAGADEIVVLDAGRIVEQGAHAALIAAGGPYRDLWEATAPTGTDLAEAQS